MSDLFSSFFLTGHFDRPETGLRAARTVRYFMNENIREKDWEALRRRMVREQLLDRGFTDNAVLAAMSKVPRHLFVAEDKQSQAYVDHPLPIGFGQTISQPYMVAVMIEALRLKGEERVLEIGTGSGYAAAILAELAKEVYTIERIKELAESARAHLQAVGAENVHVICGDGSLGYAQAAAYQAIVVTAAGPRPPENLKQQLDIGGVLVIPIENSSGDQELVRITRRDDESFATEFLGGVRFVPLLGEQGWKESEISRSHWRPRILKF